MSIKQAESSFFNCAKYNKQRARERSIKSYNVEAREKCKQKIRMEK